ncbi:MAG: SCO family protein [Woeseia sp.]
MNGLHRFYIVAATVGLVVGLSCAPQKAGGAGLPDDSYFQLELALETREGESLRLSEVHDGPLIVAMFYASCPQVCPMIISTIRAVENQLLPEAREHLHILMITLDPERDTRVALIELAERHRVDNRRWRFARTAPADVRLIAAVLDVKYRQLPDGGFNHSSPILLLDGEGREISRSEKLGVPDPVFVQKVATTIRELAANNSYLP